MFPCSSPVHRHVCEMTSDDVLESESRATASSSSVSSKASSPSSLVMAPRSTPLRTQTLRELLATIPGFSMKVCLVKLHLHNTYCLVKWHNTVCPLYNACLECTASNRVVSEARNSQLYCRLLHHECSRSFVGRHFESPSWFAS